MLRLGAQAPSTKAVTAATASGPPPWTSRAQGDTLGQADERLEEVASIVATTMWTPL